MKPRRTQNFYKPIKDFDFYSAQEILHNSPYFTCFENKCGLHGKLKGTDVLYQISPNGRVQITYSNDKDKVHCFNLLQEHLKTKLIPEKIHAWNIPYRALSITFSFCKEKITYFQKLGFFSWWERRAERKQREKEREERELDVEGYALMEGIMMNEDEWTPEKDFEIRMKYLKRFGLIS